MWVILNKLKKLYFYSSYLWLAFFLSTLVISAEPSVSTEIVESVDLEVKIDQFLDFVKDLQKQGLLDGEILVAHDGQILLNLPSENSPSFDTSKGPQFMIGSVSKQFFAVALLKSLYESSSCTIEDQKIADVKRKLQLPISQFLPEESPIWDGSMPSWTQEVSLHHLLTHTSGIPNYTDSERYEYSNLLDVKKHWFESYRSTDEIIKLVLTEPLLFSPGSKYSYCNTGYVIIADVIEAITSVSASQYVQQALFDPIGLSSTVSPVKGRWDELKLDPKLSRLVPPLKYDPRGNQSTLYPLLHCEDISVAKGAGSIISTSADLFKWNQSLHKEKSVLPKGLYNLLVTENMEEYGYGIGIENNYGGVLLGHSGDIGSYRTLLLYMPEQDLSIVVLSNICYDFDKIEDEFKGLMEDLSNTIADEKECTQVAIKMILEKYPTTRGFEMVAEKFEKLFK